MTKKLFSLISICLLCGCGSMHRYKASSINQYMLDGNYENIVSQTINAEKPHETELLDCLNGGVGLFLTGEYKKSYDIFANADHLITKHYEKHFLLQASKQAVSALNNSSIFNYEPMVLDEIYLSSYKILDSLAIGDKSSARIEVNKAYFKQQNAALYFNEEIANATQKAQKSLSLLTKQNQELLLKSRQDIFAKHYPELEKWQGYQNYMNPYTTYLSGLFFMTNAESAGDLETASTYLKRTVGMMPNNSYLLHDLKQAEQSADYNSISKDKYVWIIYENGMVADFEELKVNIPAFIATDELSIISFAMPRPRLRNEAFPYLLINNYYKTEILADVDSMFVSEFKRKLPAIITLAATQTIAKSAMQYAGNQDENDEWIGFAATVYTLTTSDADLRSWHTLPKNVQIAKVKLGSSNKLSISTAEGINIAEVQVPKDTNSIVYIRIPSIMSKTVISVIKI